MSNHKANTPDYMSREILSRYHRGELSAAESHAMEKAALSDPLLAEAMEGQEMLSPGELEAGRSSLKGKLADRIAQAPGGKVSVLPWRTLSIAASIALMDLR